MQCSQKLFCATFENIMIEQHTTRVNAGDMQSLQFEPGLGCQVDDAHLSRQPRERVVDLATHMPHLHGVQYDDGHRYTLIHKLHRVLKHTVRAPGLT